MVADTKKCCCLRRSSLPWNVRSSGYSTEDSVSARCRDRIAWDGKRRGVSAAKCLCLPHQSSLVSTHVHARTLRI